MKKVHTNTKKAAVFLILIVVFTSVMIIPVSSDPPIIIQPLRDRTELVSIRYDDQMGGDDDSGMYSKFSGKYDPISISNTGRYIAFISEATNLDDSIVNDDPYTLDVFVRDRRTDQTICVSRFGDSAFGSDYRSNIVGIIDISGNGRFVTFVADNDMVEYFGKSSNSDHATEIYIYDLETDRMHIPSYYIIPGELGWRSGPLLFQFPSLSNDGTRIAFNCNGDPFPGYPAPSVYVMKGYNYETETYGSCVLVSTYAYDYPGPDGWEAGDRVQGWGPQISGNGQYVLFTHSAAEIFTAYGNIWETAPSIDYVIIRNINDMGEYEVASLCNGVDWPVQLDDPLPDDTCGSGGYQTSGYPYCYDISYNGRYVVFSAYATNIVDGDTNYRADVFRRDRDTAQTERVSIRYDGNEPVRPCSLPSISGNGRYVTYSSFDPEIIPQDTNGQTDVFMRDMVLLRNSRISVPDYTMSPDHTESDRGSDYSVISRNGKVVAFSTQARNLVVEDSDDHGTDNNHRDVFVRLINRRLSFPSDPIGNGP